MPNICGQIPGGRLLTDDESFLHTHRKTRSALAVSDSSLLTRSRVGDGNDGTHEVMQEHSRSGLVGSVVRGLGRLGMAWYATALRELKKSGVSSANQTSFFFYFF